MSDAQVVIILLAYGAVMFLVGVAVGVWWICKRGANR